MFITRKLASLECHHLYIVEAVKDGARFGFCQSLSETVSDPKNIGLKVIYLRPVIFF
jgi:hypothetical protein